MPQREDVSAFEDEAPDDACQDDDGADDLNHEKGARLATYYRCTGRRAIVPVSADVQCTFSLTSTPDAG